MLFDFQDSKDNNCLFSSRFNKNMKCYMQEDTSRQADFEIKVTNYE